jgi:hypothetical protein
VDDAILPTTLNLAHTLQGLAGKFVAVDVVTGEPVEADDSPYVVSARVRERGLTNVAILRAPDPDDPPLVGLG